MRIEPGDIGDLRPVIQEVVRAVLNEVETERAKLDGKIAYDEASAAALLSVNRHQLRDCRLRGEISGSRCGKRVLYSRAELLKFLERQQT